MQTLNQLQGVGIIEEINEFTQVGTVGDKEFWSCGREATPSTASLIGNYNDKGKPGTK